MLGTFDYIVRCGNLIMLHIILGVKKRKKKITFFLANNNLSLNINILKHNILYIKHLHIFKNIPLM